MALESSRARYLIDGLTNVTFRDDRQVAATATFITAAIPLPRATGYWNEGNELSLPRNCAARVNVFALSGDAVQIELIADSVVTMDDDPIVIGGGSNAVLGFTSISIIKANLEQQFPSGDVFIALRVTIGGTSSINFSAMLGPTHTGMAN